CDHLDNPVTVRCSANIDAACPASVRSASDAPRGNSDDHPRLACARQNGTAAVTSARVKSIPGRKQHFSARQAAPSRGNVPSASPTRYFAPAAEELLLSETATVFQSVAAIAYNLHPFRCL